MQALPAQTLSQPAAPSHAPGCALVLMGGGARTAYQAGALKAIGHTLQNAGIQRFPFPWLFGTSAGALNATYLAAKAHTGSTALLQLAEFWSQLHSSQVYRLDVPSWAPSHLITAGLTLVRQVKQHRALLDSLPLVDTLHRAISLPAIERSLNDGTLEVLGVTASSYTSGEHWTFCQTRPEHPVQPWSRPGRLAELQPITIDHLLASAAIPFLFPAIPLWVRQERAFFGDGSMRQVAPLSPAIQFGAQRILAIGVGQPERAGLGLARAEQPSAGTIAGHAMASVFHDTLMTDVARAQRMTEALQKLPAQAAANMPFRAVDVMALQPSESLDDLAMKHVHQLPRTTRNTLAGLGVLNRKTGDGASAAALASYLLFEPDFVQDLMALGQRDALEKKDAMLRFLCPEPTPQNHAAVR
jgi:NTE family protein